MAFTPAEMAKIQEARRLQRLNRIARTMSLGRTGEEFFTGKQHLSELEKLELMPPLIQAQQKAWEFDQAQAQDLTVRAFEEQGRLLRTQIDAATQAAIASSRASAERAGYELEGLRLQVKELERGFAQNNNLMPQNADRFEVSTNNMTAQRKEMEAQYVAQELEDLKRQYREGPGEGKNPKDDVLEQLEMLAYNRGTGRAANEMLHRVMPGEMRALVEGTQDPRQVAIMVDRFAATHGLTTEYVKTHLDAQTLAAMEEGRAQIDSTNTALENGFQQAQESAATAWTKVHGAAAGQPPAEFTVPFSLSDAVSDLEAQKAQALGHVPAQPSRGIERQELPKADDYFQQTSALDAAYGGSDLEAARFDAAVGNMEARDAARFLESGHTPGMGSTAGYDGEVILETAAAMDPEGREQIYSGEPGQFMGIPVPHMPSGPAQQLDYVLSTIEMFPEHGPAQEAKNAITGSHFFGEYMRQRGYTDRDLAWKEMNREYKLQKRAQRRDTRAAVRQNKRDGSAPATASDLRQHGKRGLRQGLRSAGSASGFSPMSNVTADLGGLPD